MHRPILAATAALLLAGCGPGATPTPTVVPTTAAAAATNRALAATKVPAPTEIRETAVPRGYIARGMLSAEWPFTVDAGTLECETLAGDAQSVTFVVGDKTYAVNGIAKGTGQYLPLEEIWADDPSIPGTKVNIGPIIDHGLALCR